MWDNFMGSGCIAIGFIELDELIQQAMDEYKIVCSIQQLFNESVNSSSEAAGFIREIQATIDQLIDRSGKLPLLAQTYKEVLLKVAPLAQIIREKVRNSFHGLESQVDNLVMGSSLNSQKPEGE